ncbi:nitronate monooxygenase [Parvibaculum sp.]|jgi:nitronate monooxygenase|uniref:NAD(P)H-dependent flavin oxidoreductase n=2 Tax=Parvibaculum sp. TaxID=2024848 RepID=UPI001B287AFB|nr:nitronate monooxygenase [Parvibaculum sp.]MBO6679139.1 nitronate monooxygenase [Parvibaculum sp.]MBO6686401.1 nitronate monooxygenase [Parvibaculum sp.]MBO6904145.1 nitronate monooxygenase [Parvibaculum sp.]
MARRIGEWHTRLKLPLVAAPMFLISGPKLVLAACREGVIGTFPTPNARTVADLDEWLDRIVSGLGAADAPWAANVVVHRSNTRLDEDLDLIIRYKAPVVITALGSPRAIVERVHSYGGLVFADVNSVTFARKAAEAGVDGLVLVAAGAGGHTGNMTGFSFVPAVREFFDGPVILGGGITDGAGIRAAEVLGADLAYMGTRFIACEESLAAPAYRDMLITSTVNDLILTRAITGVAANWLKPSIAMAGYDLDAMEKNPDIDFTDPQSGAKRWAQVWSAGHGVGAIDRVENVAGLVARLREEYEAAKKR